MDLQLFPYDTGWSMWPGRYESWDELASEVKLIWGRDDPTPSGYERMSDLAGGRFLLVKRVVDALPTEYVVGYFLMDARWHPLESFPNRVLAYWYRAQWARLNDSALMKAVWMKHARPAVPAMWIPREARVWDGLSDEEQVKVWRLLEAGAPGRVLEVIDAARACGLF